MALSFLCTDIPHFQRFPVWRGILNPVWRGILKKVLAKRAQFVQVEGLGQVVVGPFLQQHDLVGGGDAGRDDDDGQRAVGGANGPDDLLARDARQHEVGDDSSGAAVLRFRDWELNGDERTFAVGGIPVALTRTEFNILELLSPG